MLRAPKDALPSQAKGTRERSGGRAEGAGHTGVAAEVGRVEAVDLAATAARKAARPVRKLLRRVVPLGVVHHLCALAASKRKDMKGEPCEGRRGERRVLSVDGDVVAGAEPAALELQRCADADVHDRRHARHRA